MKISTGNGDDGFSSLLNGKKVPKDSLVMEVLGEMDELSAFLGMVKVAGDEWLPSLIEKIQNDLYAIMALVGAEFREVDGMPEFGEKNVTFLEEEGGKQEKVIGKLQKFTLAGQNEVGARLHVARTVCRRVERLLVRYCREEETSKKPVVPILKRYFNRLSDLLFLLAYRFENR